MTEAELSPGALRFSWHALDEHSFAIDIRAPMTQVGTLYRLTAAMYALGLDIQQGRVSTSTDANGHAWSEDNFTLKIRPGVENLKSPHVLINEASARLGHLMEMVLAQELDVADFLASQNCEPPEMVAAELASFSLQFENHKDDLYTAMTLHASDRPGLLFIIARVLAEKQISVHQATILTTDGGQAEDRFYLKKNGRLPDEADIEAIKQALQSS